MTNNKEFLNKTADNFIVHKKDQRKKSTEIIHSSFSTHNKMIKNGTQTVADGEAIAAAPMDQFIYENQYLQLNTTMSDQNNDLTFKNSIKQLK